MNRRAGIVITLLALALQLSAKEYGDSALYQGMSIKLDVAMPVIESARSGGKIQDYEIAMNWRLKQRWYPTFEAGYAIADCQADGGKHQGQGGFVKAGVDISALKKGASENCLMIGIRWAGAYQGFDLTDVVVQEEYWPHGRLQALNQRHFDTWGEVVAGCQIQIVKGFQMGWYLRMKMLFTRRDKDGDVMPYYVPGYGFRDDTNWGFNYYIGYKF